MKTLSILCLLLYQFTLLGQDLYVKGVATDSIDHIDLRANKNQDSTNYEMAHAGFDSLLHYWSQQIQLDVGADTYQNYYYSLIKKERAKNKFDKDSAVDIDSILQIIQTLKLHLPADNIIHGIYYSHLSSLYNTSRDNENAITWSNKALDVYLKKEESNLNLIGREYHEQGNRYKRLGNFDKAEENYTLALQAREKIKPRKLSSIVYSYYAFATLYLDKGDYSKSLESIHRTIDSCLAVFDPHHELLISSYDAAAIVHNTLGNYEKCLENSFKVQHIVKARKGSSTYRLEKNYNRISNAYRRLGDFHKARLYLDSALVILKNSNNNAALSSAYITKHMLSNSLYEEIKNLELAMNYCLKDEWCSRVNYSIIIHNMGLLYGKAGDHHVATNYLLKAIDLKKTSEQLQSSLASSYSALAAINKYKGDLEAALHYIRLAIENSKKYKGADNAFVANYKAELGILLAKRKKFDTAEAYLLKANKSLIEKVGVKNLATLISYDNLSILYELKNDYKKSLNYALARNRVIETNELIKPLPNNSKVANLYYKLGDIDSCKYFVNKILASAELDTNFVFTEHADSIISHNPWIYLERYFKYFKLNSTLFPQDTSKVLQKINAAEVFIDKYRKQYFFEPAEKDKQQNIHAYYSSLLKQLANLYQNENQSDYLALLFKFIENGKSLFIDRQYMQSNAIQTANLTEDILIREKNLLYAYEFLSNKYSNIKGDKADSIKQDLTNQIFDIQQKAEYFLDSLEQFYPDYYQNRYEQKAITLEQSKQLALDQKQSFISYHWGDSLLHKLIINPDKAIYTQIRLDSIEQSIKIIKALLNSTNSNNLEIDYSSEKSDFIFHSQKLYGYLISDEVNLSENITIVPDGRLSNFPFDVLLYNQVDTSMSYHELPYLIKKHNISYTGSISRYASFSQRSQKAKSSYVGFAPAYADLDIINSSTFRGNTLIGPLLYNRQEVLTAKKNLEGESFIGEDGTEYMFKQHAADNGILHLAMHTKINDILPMDSHLVFEADTTNGEDGNLYVGEIAKMNLNNNLVVLSACETNVGENIAGEGILGIARAFQIAACPNIVLTNWLVDDKSSSEIMDNFFVGLKNNATVPEALRHAKLQFLESSTTIQSHPKYWAAFAFYGDNNTKIHSSQPWKTYALLAGLILLSFVLFMGNRKMSNPG